MAIVTAPNPLDPFLRKNGFLILDGGLASELERAGADLNNPLWSGRVFIDNPDLVRAVHRSYLDAGSDVITSCSYQLSIEGLTATGRPLEEAERLITESVKLALDERDSFWAANKESDLQPKPLVAASVGPYGAYLADGSEFTGRYGVSTARLRDFHLPRLELLSRAEPDLLAIETIPSLEEASVLIELLNDVNAPPAWISFSCSSETLTSAGDPFGDAVAIASMSSKIVAVGLNCTDWAYAPSLLLSADRATTKPLLCYPNAGGVWDPANRVWMLPQGSTNFGDLCKEWYQSGATLIGGCCRTRPEDIRAIKQSLLERKKSP